MQDRSSPRDLRTDSRLRGSLAEGASARPAPARSWPLALLLASVACGGKGEEAEAPTYTRDVAPILDSRCASCHYEGGVAPFALTSYALASTYAEAIADAVVDRRMPPAQPVGGCADYAPSPSLTDAEIAAIADWADDGAPEGDAADATVVEPRVDPSELDRVDLTLTMDEPYTVTGTPDDYRCFILDWPETEQDLYVTGLGAVAGNPQIVHHVVSFAVSGSSLETVQALDDAEEGPGYACYGAPAQLDATTIPIWLGGWIPGQTGRNEPEGTGILVEAGSKIVMQVHYNTEAVSLPVTDQTSLVLKVEEEVERVGAVVPVTDLSWVLADQMPIPAGSEGLVYSATTTMSEETTIYDVGLHMHSLGRGGSLAAKRADGEETCLLQMDTWDFHWQYAYRLDEPVVLEAGDALELSCVFDNPTDTEVNWGEGTSDEMCVGILYMVGAD